MKKNEIIESETPVLKKPAKIVDELQMEVEKVYPTDDFGKGIIPLTSEVMEMLGLSVGEPVEIEGERKTVARVWKANILDGSTDETVRIDTFIRYNAKVTVGDKVTIRKAKVVPAKKITVAPLEEEKLALNGEIEDKIRYNLRERYLVKEDIVPVRKDMLGLNDVSQPEMKKQTVEFMVTQVTPSKSMVVVTDETQISFEKSAEGYRKKHISYEDIGGLGDKLAEIREAVELPMKQPRLFKRLKISPPKGLILHGIPGTGKTIIARAVADEIGANFYYIAGPEIMKSGYGQSEEKIRELFAEAAKNAPAIIFIDEIDSIAPKREQSGEVERRIVSQLLTVMDGMMDTTQVFVIGTTNRIHSIDPALRRPGRFDREIEIGAPDAAGREEIIRIHARAMPLEGYPKIRMIEAALRKAKEKAKYDAENGITDEETKSADKDTVSDYTKKLAAAKEQYEMNAKTLFKEMAAQTQGYVGADLAALCREAALNAVKRIAPTVDLDENLSDEILETLVVTNRDFERALKNSEPSALREIYIEIPEISWDDIGGLENVKRQIIETLEWPLKYPEKFEQFGIEPPKGILLYGPPGTGKTMLAQAVAHECETSFISVKSTELLLKWVGESEKAMKEIFRKAKQASPTIIFFDEIDAFGTARESGSGGTRSVAESTLNQMLVEMDGIERLKDVFVVAATNRPDTLDPALIRPGRLDRMVYVGVPDLVGRKSIFEIYLKKTPLSDDVSIEKLAETTRGYTGADIEAVCREAVMTALRTDMNVQSVTAADFDAALDTIRPSVGEELNEKYEKMEDFIKHKDEPDDDYFTAYN
ncbi:ATP-dependent zinc metalloprotease FtsH [Methanimicrococcus stummii]|uniref:ATP-dependent zinc metalloprotease FtsH n=1 Tax=Methanimicrococcus stummii TaxID=3028294 RepID=A0AA96ZZ57_9EURY|nr:CDC48 family AAA ATPase [Methanimicrococcus sp. Es2]WNY28882.1 ATP-dependent zinc metalloprotease FtsH [Methanimicrococcus sp. Es2]